MPVSKETMNMAGLLVDIYGLDQVPPPSRPCPLTCLWLLHPRLRSRSSMQDIAERTLAAWHQTYQYGARRRSLIALAFDMPNHGSRKVCETSNLDWEEGNLSHARDMFNAMGGGAATMSLLMGLVGFYTGRGAEIDAHVCLGWSLGGHTAWWSLFGEPRLDGAVVVVGCADYISLMTERHKESPLPTPSPFLGSVYFPSNLVTEIQKVEPKARLFGATAAPPPSPPLSTSEQARLRDLLDAKVRGKKMLVCSGGDDKLVPYARSAPLLAVLKDAVRPGGWYEDGGFVLEDRVYEGVGHKFSEDMVRDSVKFLVRIVSEGPRDRGA
ncbi:hypothetical protein E4U60_000958 [Claviceps pazoutovae]|uniref:AB hydrolase-1 domain-containing protein n=1 Tax=Claviceps pazoutovae TaxID=1649127 RepID=A0A9P7SIA1_9HYPO|nr:hypothetical protein E4U60_000958 [Claviceps pazoutovae]